MGFARWFPEAFRQYGTHTVFDALIRFIRENRFRLDPSRYAGRRITYHDPCNYGRKSEATFGHGYYEEPRWILSRCVPEFVELPGNRRRQICCGGGGGALVNGYNDERIRYGGRKMEQIRQSGADIIVVPCHSCHGQLENIKEIFGMPELEVKYLWEVVADCIVR